MATSRPGSRGAGVRPLPQPPLPQGKRYILCVRGDRCKQLGERCTYAHSEEERLAWNRELDEIHRGEII